VLLCCLYVFATGMIVAHAKRPAASSAPSAPVVTAATPATTKPRFQQAIAKASGSSFGGSDIRAGSQSNDRTRAGGEWWVKDPPWFLPPPPEWGPMPPTMYTSFFHRPRYPSLSTANYYPLYSRTDEYDAHLPASMSRRATYTQQMIYDNYVNTYRQHTHFTAPTGDPNVGVSTPFQNGLDAQFGGMGAAHQRALELGATANTFPMYSRTNSFHTSPVNAWATQTQGFAANNGMPPSWGVGFVEADATAYSPSPSPSSWQRLQFHSGQYGNRAVTYFASGHIPIFKPAHSAKADSDSDSDSDSDVDADADSDSGAED